MSKYTISDVQKADDLWDEMPLSEVSAQTSIPEGTLDNWSQDGLISTDTNHRRGYSDRTVEKADSLYDRMPLKDISDALDIPLGTLKKWNQQDWISTSRDFNAERCGSEPKGSPGLAKHLVREEGMLHREVAEKMGVHESTISKYLSDY